MTLCAIRCSQLEPRAALSRGVIGSRQGVVVANLPGRPKAVRETLAAMLPLLLDAVAEAARPLAGESAVRP